MRKKLFMVILCLLFTIIFPIQIVYAESDNICLNDDTFSDSGQFRFDYIEMTTTGFKKSGNTVNIDCDLSCYNNTAKCSITVYLQRKTGSSSWTTEEIYSDSVNGTSLSIEEDKTVSSGTYRITAYYHAYSSTTATSPIESVSATSPSVTIS